MDAPGIATRELRFRYRKGAEELFDGLTHVFAPAAITAVTGASGRGKSTLLYLLGLTLTPSSGQVLIDGAAASELTDRERSRLRARRIGFVFQDSELDPTRPVLDSVMEPGLYAGHSLTDTRTRARELLAGLGLEHRADHRPGQISGGQAQRVAVCRALVNSPTFILADEPTGNLDPDNANLVLGALRQAAESGCSVIIATHDPTVVNAADEVVRL
ncbi:ABC transporter ATP-binding protein [Actinotignum schaalii]|uniref:ABC transporter ATP-binding protein n=1 Tax=Actinotignum schaalii TaxID=59505 RepID=UPI0003FD66CB|nr:ATP-binding cassette domain-containing protein [Actinotignum schaalii]AIE83176.1 ABC transporter [Actinotignum schaalii]WQN45367.1 ATP-binding cassette domain-containing protein [Actinotignum schaalii]